MGRSGEARDTAEEWTRVRRGTSVADVLRVLIVFALVSGVLAPRMALATVAPWSGRS